MAPSTTGSPGAAPAGNGASHHLGQRRPPAKGVASHHSKPHVVVPVLPLPFTKHRHRPSQPAVASPTAGSHAVKSPTAAAPLRSPTSPLAVEVDFPNIAALAIAAPNGTDAAAPKNDFARNGNGTQTKKHQPIKDATAGVESALASSQQHQQHQQEPSFAGPGQAAGREPLSAHRSTNAVPAAAPSPGAYDGFAPPHPPRGKENIPPTANGYTMAQAPAFEPPRIPMHHPNHLSLSDSSVMFGAHPDSNNTSPAPPSTGRYHPPAHMQLPPFPLRHDHNAYPPPGPPPGHMGRPLPMPIPTGAMPGYPGSVMMNFAPSTPQSFHGSQASNPPDGPAAFEENGYAALPPPHMMANAAGMRNDHSAAFPPAPSSARHATFNHPRSHDLAQMHQRDAREYIELNFNNPETADCQLTITFLGDSEDRPWRAPLRLFGHRLVLGFSPTLRAHIQSGQHQGGNLTVSSEDPYLRNNVLWTCLGSLYGRPIPDYPEGDDPIVAASYVAAGNFLQLGAITMKGADDMIRLLNNWVAVEIASSLALNGAVHRFPGTIHPPTDPDFLPRHGPASVRILDAVAGFIIDNFPRNFVVDPKFAPPPYSRIPEIPQASAGYNSASSLPTPDELANGPVRQPALRYSNPSLLSQIKFGDIPLAENGTGEAHEAQQPSQPAPVPLSERLADLEPNPNRLLTSILVNLPFGVLKGVMESSRLGNGPGQLAQAWPTTQTRYKLMSQIIDERERRRVEAIKAVMSGAVADQSIKERLFADHPPLGGPATPWDVLGWVEEVAGSDEVPHLVRSWVPIRSVV